MRKRERGREGGRDRDKERLLNNYGTPIRPTFNKLFEKTHLETQCTPWGHSGLCRMLFSLHCRSLRKGFKTEK